MATSVKLTQVQSIPPPGDPHEGEYELEATFSDAATAGADPGGNWDNAFFLIKIIDTLDATRDVYQHVCTVGDLEKYENTRGAVVPPDVYYRTATWPSYFSSIEDIDTETTLQQTRTQNLCDDWEEYGGGTWPKTDIGTFTSS